VASGTYAFSLAGVFALWDAGRIIEGTIAAMGIGVVCLGVIPGLLSRLREFGADRLGARLLGGGATMSEALLRLAELKLDPPEREHLTHPSIRRRVEALSNVPE
jgi:Zn-dependent protease with chaperone function